MALKYTTGIYDMSAAEYHGLTDYINNSYLGKLDKCAAAAHVPTEETDTLLFGRGAHSLTLEGLEAFFKEFVVTPNFNRRTKDGKNALEEFMADNEGKAFVSADDFQLMKSISESVHKHPFAHDLLAKGVSEQTVIWQDEETGLWCKCRPDRIPSNASGVLVDLKTTKDAGEYAFCRSVVAYGYARQAAWYLDGTNAATGSNFDAFVFVAVEKTAPFRVETYLLDEEFIDYGRREYRRLLQKEMECRMFKSYPNYQSPNLVTLYKPSYL